MTRFNANPKPPFRELLLPNFLSKNNPCENPVPYLNDEEEEDEEDEIVRVNTRVNSISNVSSYNMVSGDEIPNAKTGTSSLAMAAAATSVMMSAMAANQKKVEERADPSFDSSTIDQELELVQHRDLMARTIQRYLVPDVVATFQERMITGGLIALTTIAILALFWYQNFGPGFNFKHVQQF